MDLLHRIGAGLLAVVIDGGGAHTRKVQLAFQRHRKRVKQHTLRLGRELPGEPQSLL